LAGFDEIMSQIAASGDDVAADTELDDNPEGTDEDLAGSDDGQADNSEETDPDPAFDPNSITDPALQEQYRRMQASFTPKLQEAARLREQYSNLDPVAVEAVRTYQNLLQTDPRQAREFIAQQAAWLDQQLGVPQQEADPFAGIDPMTPTEEALLNFARNTYKQQQELLAYKNQLEFSRQQEIAERQFAQVETKYKAQIPLEEKQQVWAYMQQNGIKDAESAWKILNFDKIAKQGAVRQAQTTQQKKKNPPPPTNRQQRSAPAPANNKGKGVGSYFEEAWNKSNAG
jgi:hypothetical protein